MQDHTPTGADGPDLHDKRRLELVFDEVFKALVERGAAAQGLRRNSGS